MNPRSVCPHGQGRAHKTWFFFPKTSHSSTFVCSITVSHRPEWFLAHRKIAVVTPFMPEPLHLGAACKILPCSASLHELTAWYMILRGRSDRDSRVSRENHSYRGLRTIDYCRVLFVYLSRRGTIERNQPNLSGRGLFYSMHLRAQSEDLIAILQLDWNVEGLIKLEVPERVTEGFLRTSFSTRKQYLIHRYPRFILFTISRVCWKPVKDMK